MKKFLIPVTIAFLTAPAFALDGNQPDAHQVDEHSAHAMHGDAEKNDHDHEAHDHESHDHDETETNERTADSKHATITKTDDIVAALDAGGEPIIVDILGVVCDFCAKAMNKTFGKRDEVAATYVDLDTKAMSLVLVPGAVLDDETITKLVKKAGYRASAIRRGDQALNGGGDAADHS